MLTRQPRTELTCRRCGAVLDTRVVRYQFVTVGWRGRVPAPGSRDRRGVFCGPCGVVLAEVMMSNGFPLDRVGAASGVG